MSLPTNPFASESSSAPSGSSSLSAASVGWGPVRGAVSTKPFSGYQPSSPISPYLQMYRSNSGVGLDNYNLFVRPALEQQAFNRSVQSQVGSLRAGTWGQPAASPYQASASGPMDNPWQGRAMPPTAGTYMNLNPFYPGSGAGLRPTFGSPAASGGRSHH